MCARALGAPGQTGQLVMSQVPTIQPTMFIVGQPPTSGLLGTQRHFNRYARLTRSELFIGPLDVGRQRIGTEIFCGPPTARYSCPGKTPYGTPKRHYVATEWYRIDLSER